VSRLPNFFIVGTVKAGTTSLYSYLDQHPQIYMSAIKEPHFFAPEFHEDAGAKIGRGLAADTRELLSGPMLQKRFWGIVTDWNDYLRLFANATTESALGEASVCYLWSPTAPERIAAKIPGAKILVLLRNPVDRAFSQYLHGLGNGAIRWTFREHIERNLRHNSSEVCLHYPFLEFGLYSEQLGRYLKKFGENVWIGFYDDFRSRPLDVLRSIFQFLNVDPNFSPDMTSRNLEPQVPRVSAVGWLKRSGAWRAAAGVTPPGLRPLIRRALNRAPGTTRMDLADRRYLIDFYRKDVHKLADLVGRNLDRWNQ